MANERRIIELVLKAVGDRELKAITRDLVSMRKAAEDSQRSLAGMQAGLANFAKLAVAAVGIGTVVNLLRDMVRVGAEAIKEMDELSVTISKVGVAAADFQKLQFAANLSNVSAEALNKGLVKLSVALADVGNKNSAATRALRELGVTAGTSTLDAMKKLADEFAKMPDGAEKTAKAVQYFGKAGADLIPLLNEGSEGLAAMFTEAEKLGLVLSNEALAGANMFGDELDRLGAVVDADVKKFMGGLAPALITIAQLLTGAAANSADFESAGAALGGVLVALAADVIRFGKTLQAYGNAAVSFINAMGQAVMAFDQLAQGNVAASDTWMRAAKLNLEAASLYWNNAEKIGDAAAARVQTQYRQNIAAIRREAAQLGAGGAAGDGEAGTGRAGAAARASARGVRELHVALVDTSKALADLAARPLPAIMDPGAQLDAALAADAIRRNYDAAGEAAAAAAARREEEMQKAQEQWQFLADAAGQATYDIITGTEKIGRAFKRMVASIVADLVRLAAQKLIMSLLGISDFGNTGQAVWSKLFGSANANGNAFGPNGIVTQPTMFAMGGGGIGIMGEAGPEAILPLQRNASGQLGVAASGGGLSVVVNNNVPGAAVQVRPTDQGLQIDLIERQLADRVRRGGSALPGALENTYRTGRQASAY
jgi:hypothetical protein